MTSSGSALGPYELSLGVWKLPGRGGCCPVRWWLVCLGGGRRLELGVPGQGCRARLLTMPGWAGELQTAPNLPELSLRQRSFSAWPRVNHWSSTDSWQDGSFQDRGSKRGDMTNLHLDTPECQGLVSTACHLHSCLYLIYLLVQSLSYFSKFIYKGRFHLP